MRLLLALVAFAGLAAPAAAALPCPGDCDADARVTVDEVVAAVNIALGVADLTACPAADTDAGGSVSVDEIVRALDAALAGCAEVAPFVEFPWQQTTPDPRHERLCAEAADPDNATDTTFIDCDVEGASFAPPDVEPKRELTVVAWNILRGFETDAQIAAMLESGDVPLPDVVLLSEVDRGCRRTGFRNVARAYAEALGFHYVYATEFVELPSQRGPSGPYDPPLCEHGNAIVSRYPLGNVRQIRHARNHSWYTPPDFPDPDEPRLGGRVAVAADMKVGDRLVRLYSLHFESTLSALRIRDAQAVEIASDGATVPGPVIAGGDINSFFARLDFENGWRNDGTTQAFLTRGYSDAHAGLPLAERDTNFDPAPLIIDFVFVRNAAVVDAGLCPRERCGTLSDHLPVWAVVDLGD
jgi:endonuclease/exonuclease/phosphatase family metal-dependent hydrolase